MNIEPIIPKVNDRKMSLTCRIFTSYYVIQRRAYASRATPYVVVLNGLISFLILIKRCTENNAHIVLHTYSIILYGGAQLIILILCKNIVRVSKLYRTFIIFDYFIKI